MFLKSSLFAKSLSAFVTLPGLWSVGYKYLTKHHLKHSSSFYIFNINQSFPWMV